MASISQEQLSIFKGPPLDSEPGLGPLTVPGYFAAVTRRYADREAVVAYGLDSAPLRWNYSDLYAHAEQVARSLIASGLPKGGLVALLVTNRPEWLASLFGVLMAGGVAVPLSTFSTQTELAHLLRTSCASTLIYEGQVLKKNFTTILSELEPAVEETAPGRLMSREFPFLRSLIAVGKGTVPRAVEPWDTFVAAGLSVDPAVVGVRSDAVNSSDPALVYFSSGSTGKPKGIINSQRSVAIMLWRWRRIFGFSDNDRIRGWCANGFFWSGAFAQAVGATFSSGGTLVLQPTFDAKVALDLFRNEHVNYLVCWPHQYAQFPEAPNYGTADLSSLKYLTRGTAIETHPTLKTDWHEPVCSYGSTETFTVSTCIPHAAPLEEWGNSNGKVLPGNTVRIVDPESGRTQPLGKSGEIAVKGATLMLGYVGVPIDETLDDEGFFRTGDRGRFDEEGRLYFEGRLTDMIKTGGANVSPREIDAVLAETDGVLFSQTVGVPHDTLGEMMSAVSCHLTPGNLTKRACAIA